MAQVLVTGASGFIGAHVAAALVGRGEQVTCLVRRAAALQRLEPLGVSIAYGDLTDRESLRAAVAGKSAVYHVAGCTRALRAGQFYEVNEEGTRNVALACAEQASPPVLVAVSSLAAAGPSAVDRPRVETDPLVQVSQYSRSKRAGELAAQQFADRVPITVLRPPIVLGQWDKEGLPMFRGIARAGLHLVPSGRGWRYSVIHAADLAQAMILAAERGARLAPLGAPRDAAAVQGFYFVAAEENPTYGELGRMVAAAMGRRRLLVLPAPIPIVWATASIVELAARIRGRPLYLNFDKVREIRSGSWTCSPRKAIDELGFSTGAPLAERLAQTARWYRDAGWL